MTIGERIKQLRKFHNLNQEIFAKKIGVSKPTVSEYELNKCKPSQNTIYRICQYFGISREWLIDDIGEMYPVSSPEEIDSLPMPDPELMEATIKEGEKIKQSIAKQFGLSMPELNDLLNITMNDSRIIKTFIKAMQSDESAKKELMRKLLE